MHRCPRCHNPTKSVADLHYCRRCDAYWDDDPFEGGEHHDSDPSRRLVREEERRARKRERFRR